MEVSAKSPYVYFDYLQNTYPETWENACSLVEKFNGSSKISPEERLQTAISYLKIIEKQQRDNEEKFLRAKIKDLELFSRQTKDKELHAEIMLLLVKLNKIKENGFNYIEFTSILNKIILKTKSYEARLKSLIQNMNKENKGNPNRGLLVGIDKEIKALQNLLNGEKYAGSKTFEKLLAEILYEELIKIRPQSFDTLNASFFNAGLIKLQIKLRMFLEEQGILINTKGNKKQIEILREKINFFLKEDTFANNFLQGKIQNREFQELCDIFNISTPTTINPSQINKFKEIRNPFSNNSSSDSTYILSSSITDSTIAEKISLISETVSNGVIVKKHTGKINLGDDLMIGYIYSQNPSIDLNQNQLQKTLDDMEEAQKYFANRRNQRSKYKQENKEMIDKMEKALKELDNSLSKNGNLTHGFILHESTKYYKDIEEGNSGRWSNELGRKGSGFHGRTLNIMAYIDTMQNISSSFDNGLNTALWPFIALNLGEHSPARGLIDDLEMIFSTVACLILFDDAAIMFKEATEKNFQFSNLTNLHLYRLQNLYFPASYIIQQSILNLTYIGAYSDAATAKIFTVNNPYTSYYADSRFISNKKHQENKDKGVYKKKNSQFMNLSSEKRWEKVKHFTQSNTEVSINFFLNFQNFIQRLGTL